MEKGSLAQAAKQIVSMKVCTKEKEKMEAQYLRK